MSRKQFRSANFPNVYLRIDGTGMNQPLGPGGGVVNCQFGAGPWETHDVVTQPDGSITIGSTAFTNVFLRLDGSGVTKPSGPGGGVVNCQYTAGPYEKFRLTQQPNGSTALESVAFPGVFLRMDGSGVTHASDSGGGKVNGQFTAGPYEQFIIESADQTPSEDYLSYFFLRNKGAGGPVLGFAPTGTKVVGQPMLPHRRGTQLFKCVAVAVDSKFILLVNQSTQLALQADDDGSVRFAPQDTTVPGQQWAFTAKDQIVNATQGSKVLALNNSSLAFANPDDIDATQKFEMFYPSDFVYVRNCWTGRFMTAGPNDSVSWALMSAANDDNQQWGITSDGMLVNRGSGKVLQLAAAQPTPGAIMILADQVASGPGNANQRFDMTSIDGTLHCCANNDFVIGKDDTNVVSELYAAVDHTQLIEFISPFQFFSIQNQAVVNGAKLWLARNGSNLQLEINHSSGLEQLFTISRYGELINPIDGFVMQSQGDLKIPLFVDPAPDPIGFDTTTFIYQGDRAYKPGTGAITLRSGGLSLIVYRGTPVMYDHISNPVDGNQAWALVGPNYSLFSAYEELARSFFSTPAPLPSQASNDFELSQQELSDLSQDKTTRVILTIVTGLLGLVGISVGTVSLGAARNVAQIVLGESSVAATIAVIMQGTVTASSIIAVADGITHAGLWLKLVEAVLPNSFWGWAITVAKLGATIAGFAFGVGWAVKGAQIALMVADVLVILSSDKLTANLE
ncbi:hypothetical protein ACLBWT_18915 [Paenibacillus sp. D51F]